MPNYQNGKIYSIRSYQTDMIYIGSTCQSLAVRKGAHKQNYQRYQNGKGNYVTSFEIIKYDDAYIELVEAYPCNNRYELCRREGELIREMDNVINKRIAGRTHKEWREDNKEYNKEYYEANKDKISEQMKQWREDNKDKQRELNKQYYEANKDNLREQRKVYNQANVNKYKCYCCDYKSYSKNNLNIHLRTNRHKDKYNKYIYDYAIESGASHELAHELANALKMKYIH